MKSFLIHEPNRLSRGVGIEFVERIGIVGGQKSGKNGAEMRKKSRRFNFLDIVSIPPNVFIKLEYRF